MRAVWGLRLGRELETSEPENTVGAVRTPLLLTHGSGDAVIPGSEMERLVRAAGPGVRVVEVAGAGHSDLAGFAAYREAVVRFLEDRAGRP